MNSLKDRFHVGQIVFDVENKRVMSVHAIEDEFLSAHWLDESGVWHLDKFTAE